jgi:type II secretory pathway component PulM
MWDIAFAQGTAASSGPSTLVSLFPLVLIFVIFYFLLVRPQQKKSKDHRNMLAQLKKNDYKGSNQPAANLAADESRKSCW